jgi:hypothetical protein
MLTRPVSRQITITADSVEEARQVVQARVAADEMLAAEKTLRPASSARLVIWGKTESDIHEFVSAIISEHTVVESRTAAPLTLAIAALGEAEARRIAEWQANNSLRQSQADWNSNSSCFDNVALKRLLKMFGFVVQDIAIRERGRAGFLGIGRKPTKYDVTMGIRHELHLKFRARWQFHLRKAPDIQDLQQRLLDLNTVLSSLRTGWHSSYGGWIPVAEMPRMVQEHMNAQDRVKHELEMLTAMKTVCEVLKNHIEPQLAEAHMDARVLFPGNETIRTLRFVDTTSMGERFDVHDRRKIASLLDNTYDGLQKLHVTISALAGAV